MQLGAELDFMLVSTNLEDYNYAICGEQFEETLEHLFIHCRFASQCWCTLEFRSFANFGRLQGNSTSTILHGDFQVKYNFTMVIHPPHGRTLTHPRRAPHALLHLTCSVRARACPARSQVDKPPRAAPGGVAARGGGATLQRRKRIQQRT